MPPYGQGSGNTLQDELRGAISPPEGGDFRRTSVVY